MREQSEKQKGQILLITVMLLAAAVTVVMTIAFNSTTDTQITKLEEDSQKALSAAEAALEAAIQKKGNVALDSLPAFAGTNITGQADIVELGGTEFVTPLLQRDEQYTFYLSPYVSETNTFGTPWSSGDMAFYFKSETVADCPALEFTFINTDNSQEKSVADPCSSVLLSEGAEKPAVVDSTDVIKGFSFTKKITAYPFTGVSNRKLLIVRVLNAPTRLAITAGDNLPPQGRVITSQATTPGGATKKIELFQSYPQIPAEFFVTGF